MRAMIAAVKTELQWIDIDRCIALRRNPQYVSPHAMEALKASIRRDGFLAPILLRPMDNGDYEVVSGNHRVMAARELGMAQVPAVIAVLDDRQVGRIAVNLNTVHGDPTVELLAPFLAELDDDILGTVHLPDALMSNLKKFDAELSAKLAEMQIPDDWNHPSPKAPVPDCVCPTCGKRHARPPSDGE